MLKDINCYNKELWKFVYLDTKTWKYCDCNWVECQVWEFYKKKSLWYWGT